MSDCCCNLIEALDINCSDIQPMGLDNVFYCSKTGNVYDELNNFLGVGLLNGKELKIIPGKERKSKFKKLLKWSRLSA